MDINTLTWIVYFVAGAIFLAIIYIYFTSVFDKRYSTPFTIGTYIAVYLANIFFILSNSFIINILTSVIFFGVLICLYSGNLKARISMAIFIYMASFLSEYLTGYSIMIVKNVSTEHLAFGTPEFLYGLLISKIILTVLAKVLTNITRRRRMPKMTTLHWIAVVITPAGGFFVLHNMSLSHSSVNPNIMDIIASIVIVIINFIVLNVYDKILADHEADTKNKLLEEQVRYYGYQYFLAEASEKLIYKTRHDIKNLLIGLRADIYSNKIDNVEKRITELLGDINALDGPAKSGNIAIDSIINFKINIAREQQIYFSLDLIIPDNLELDSTLICSVVGNALDNAIEAVEKVKYKSKRIIRINMSYKQETLFLQIINPFEGEIITDKKGNILSSKKDFLEEGIGLQSIKNALENDRGNVEITYNGDKFSISVAMFGVSISKGTLVAR